MTYEDLVDLARICLQRAEAATNPQTATGLRRMAQEYEQRAAAMKGLVRSAVRDQSQ
jgi:hypothetical protein